MALKAPFPWFGGKSRVADLAWRYFGDVPNYVEPFFGSGAVLLGRPDWHKIGIETVNDKDGFVANFWRALQAEPAAVAEYADNPVNENDLHARHAWLVGQIDDFAPRLEGDPDFYDVKIAGWWVWGICCWIGSGFCSGNGPWRVVDGQLIHLGGAGQGVSRQLIHLGGAGRGVSRQLIHLGGAGQGLLDYMETLAARLRYARVACGDWSRICTPAPTYALGLTGVFLDPPYGEGELDYREDDKELFVKVRDWCLENGDNELLRIALCGYEGQGHEELEDHGWSVRAWKANGGYGSLNKNGNDNPHRERIWFSPHCVAVPKQRYLL